MQDDIYGHIIDCLNIYPQQSLHEVIEDKACFKTAAQVRSIQYTSSKATQKMKAISKIDWVIQGLNSDTKNINAENTAIVINQKLPLLSYLKLRTTKPVKRIIRIDTAQNYISSEKRYQRYKRAYKNTSYQSIIKFIVALKVALRPANTYPVMVYVS